MSETARKLLTKHEFPGCVVIKRPMSNKSLEANLNPPKVRIEEALRGWAALVLAVQEHTSVSMHDLLRHDGRSGRDLVAARHLLVWAFLEVSDAGDRSSMAWLEQCMRLCRRRISEAVKGAPPARLPAVIQTYRRLALALGPEDIADTIAAGLLGQRRPRSRVWPKGFLERLGLRSK